MNDTLRAADRDREETVATLREHYAQGRLSLEEFDERSTAAYAARTLGELRPLTADLPAVSEPREAAWSSARMRWIAVAGAVAAVLFVVVAAVAGRAVLAWPAWLVALVVIKIARGRGMTR
jgi:hypothetical protein